MFMFLFSEGMAPFYRIISSFPTVFFTFLLALCLIFWLIAILGVIDIDVLDLPDTSADSSGMVNGAAGLLMKLGLNGVPLTVSLSLIAIFGWAISYNTTYFSNTESYLLLMRWVANIGIFVIALIGSIFLTALVLKPVRSLFNKMSADFSKNIIGQIAIVRTSRVDTRFGEAVCQDGGAGLTLKVRAYEGVQFKKNDRVVLLEYIESENAYRIISEEEFTRV
ncbi:MAG: DUF1449 domain-containing protein [Marinagarivorans sp.]|nr:DUF1449 domain-containing protein [Marinagarivorans sp.]